MRWAGGSFKYKIVSPHSRPRIVCWNIFQREILRPEQQRDWISSFLTISDSELRLRDRQRRQQPAGHDRGEADMSGGEAQQYSALT